jgi:hypothetical protein
MNDGANKKRKSNGNTGITIYVIALHTKDRPGKKHLERKKDKGRQRELEIRKRRNFICN